MSRLTSLAKVCGSLVSRTTPSRASSIFSARNVSAKLVPSVQSAQVSFIHKKLSCFSTRSYSSGVFESLDKFTKRHIGSGKEEDLTSMLNQIGLKSLDELINKAVPPQIRLQNPLQVGPERGETELLRELKSTAQQNKLLKNFIGMGYYGTVTPNVILRNIIENPAWYTPYTPYQAEISQGRLESLLNYQTMVADLTGLPMSNASLLDEATAAAEAMFLTYNIAGKKKDVIFFVSELCHPQTISVVKTRAEWMNIKVVVGDHKTLDPSKHELCGALIQYPATDGSIADYKSFVEKVHATKALVVCATDLLALTMLTPPGEFGVDIAVGNAQRFGVPLGYGGPHAAFLATKDEYKRMMPGRIIGVSKDSRGQPAMRLSLQTREQHIRREKATSNICTAQVLLANVNAMYAVYHGPKGLRTIAEHVHGKANVVATHVKELGFKTGDAPYFDTVRVELNKTSVAEFQQLAIKNGINVRALDNKTVTVSVDEATTQDDIAALLNVFAQANGKSVNFADKLAKAQTNVTIPANFHRKSAYLTHPVFNSYHSEHEMLRYIFRLHNKDLGLVHSMIPLGSCTMKLNATAEMIPVTWPEFNSLHPFVPVDQAQGYQKMFNDLERQLADITGFHSVSLQPNAGSQGEYAGLLAIRQYQKAHKQNHRDICLIPVSAHGTNPASAMMLGLQVVPVNCDEEGNIDVPDLKAKAEKYKEKLSCIMITYPSTHGVFEGTVKEICKAVHDNGGQVYMDGANMNAQVGLTKPGELGADVCHLNLHKTFCIPHGGGGPGMGPICVAKHLAPFLPSHPVVKTGGSEGLGAVSAGPWGSSSILPIVWVYINLMGSSGLKKATQVAILNANYMASRLEKHYKIMYRGQNGMVAHEFILDVKPFKKVGIEAEDFAKRLMDFGFHAPTMSWPVVGSLMIEPTESESKEELDRYVDALIAIREEVRAIEEGKMDPKNNPLKNAPHTMDMVMSSNWDKPYTREQAAFPLPFVQANKFWPSVGRVDNTYGDRNLICTCPSMSEFEEPKN